MSYVDQKRFLKEYDYAIGRRPRMKIAIDFETNSNVPLKEAGLGPYSRDPQLQVLMTGVAMRTGDGALISTTLTIEDALAMASWARTYASLRYGPITYAHNSAFEMAVFSHFVNWSTQIRCTAMLARIFGANSRLKWAGPQLVGTDKLTSGKEFIRVFCMGDPRLVDQAFIDDHRQLWEDGKIYCANDAEVSLLIGEQYDCLEDNEWESFFLTHEMNRRGWHTDVELAKQMREVRDINVKKLEPDWRTGWSPMNNKGQPLLLSSPTQVKDYIHRLGYQTKSTDKVAMKRLKKRAELRIAASNASTEDYEMRALVELKEELGGTSLSKLDTLLKQVCEDERLRYQYSHCGAGQTWRTSGVGVQMQNLKRLGEHLHDMDLGVRNLTNPEMAENLRQVFFADRRDHTLLVSDLASIEARVLAWFAWEEWKLEAIKRGEDLYKLLAMDIHSKPYDEITKALRSHGKVGELGGGYGMGGQALKDFAEKMGIELTLNECYAIITAYRAKNIKIKSLWYALNEAMISALQQSYGEFSELPVGPPGAGYTVRFSASPEGKPIEDVMAGTQMLEMALYHNDSKIFWRVWRGCYVAQGKYGSEVIYHRSPISPSRSKLWVDHSIDKETKVKYTNKLYGGKLTGVLVQSFARELFFAMLKEIDKRIPGGARIIGQFHDEVVIDTPLATLGEVSRVVWSVMTHSPYPDLPVDCEIKHAYRYTK